MKRSPILLLAVPLLLTLLFACGQREESSQMERLLAPTGDLVAGVTDMSGPVEMVDLIAGQTEDIGSVTCWITRNRLFVEYGTEGDWSLAETHLAVAESVGDIPSTPSGNPKVGLFPLKKEHPPFTMAHTESLDMDDWGFSEASKLVIAAHADVHVLSGEGAVLREEGAWGAGVSFGSVVPSLKDVSDLPEGLERLQRPGKGRGNWATYFTVDVNKLRGLILWNKLGSEHEVTHSRVGPDGVIVGDIEYLPCKYGNGFRPLERTGDHNIPGNFIDFSGLNLGAQGCIEFWYHPDWIDWRVGHIVDPFRYGEPAPGGEQKDVMLCHYNDWQNLFYFGVFEGYGPVGNWTFASVYLPPSTIPGWSTTEPFHIAFTWDGTAPNPSDRAKLFVNGDQIGSGSYRGDPTFGNWSPEARFRLGCRTGTGDWDRHNWEGSEGIIDNVKIWSYAKTDFSDRFKE